MRILYGITKSNFGGAQRYVYDLATKASKKGNTVAVLAGGRGTLTDKLDTAGIEVISLERLGRDISVFDDAQSFFKVMNILSKYKPQVFHINSSKMGGIGGLAARIMQVPKIIFTAHGWAFNEDRPQLQKLVIKFLHWITILLSHKTICVSEKTYNDIAKWPFIKRKLAVVRNGIETFNSLSRSEARKILIPEYKDSFIVGTIAELHHVKGLDVLLHAWSEFEERSHSKLVIVGSGDERNNLEELAELLGISDSVIFTGFVDNAKSYLKAFDIFVLPSRSEGLPYVVLEAGVAGLPVIASRVGGIPEIIDDEENGLLVPAGSDEWLERALNRLAKDENLRKKLGMNLKSTIEKKYSVDIMVRQTLHLY